MPQDPLKMFLFIYMHIWIDRRQKYAEYFLLLLIYYP